MKKGIKIIIAFCTMIILVFFSHRSFAQPQYYFYDNDYLYTPVIYEFGVSAGVVNCLTDLGGTRGVGGKWTKDLNLGNNEFLGGLYFGALRNETIGIRLEANFGRLSAYDSILSNVEITNIARARYNRNLSFRSNITEIALIAEFHPLWAFINWSLRDNLDPPRFSPYLLGGIGYFKFNPQANLNGRWIDLQPLRTEGQGFEEYPNRKPYSLNGISFPFGAGLKYEISQLLNLRAEFVYRPTNTDYIDDVSTTFIDKTLFQKYLTGAKLRNALLLNDRQRGEYLPQSWPNKKRGNIHDKDNYFSLNIKLSVNLGRERR